MAALLGVGLAMDAFSVSLANGLADRDMKTGKLLTIAGTFAGFQFAMPMIGWFCVHRAEEKLEWFGKLVPWIALLLLLYIGGKMLKEGMEEDRETKAAAKDAAEMKTAVKDSAGMEGRTDEEGEAGEEGKPGAGLGAGELIMQGIATSIDALSVGFTIASYTLLQALASSLIIGAVTLVICIFGLRIGRRLGTVLAGKASILGGVILICIGLEIWIKGVFM